MLRVLSQIDVVHCTLNHSFFLNPHRSQITLLVYEKYFGFVNNNTWPDKAEFFLAVSFRNFVNLVGCLGLVACI